MPDPNLGQVAASVWDNVIGRKPTDNIFNARAFFFLMQDGGFKEQADGGKLIEFTLEYAVNTTFKSYGEFETIDTTRVDVFDAAQFGWKINAGTVVYSELERLRNQANSGKFDVIAEKLENGKESHIDQLNIQCLSDGTGNGSQDIGGIQLIIAVAPTTGTVGSINRATFSFWRNIQASGAKTTSAFDNLRATMRTVYNRCSRGGLKDLPTGVFTDRAVFEGYEGLLTANERYTNKTEGNAGFRNDVLMFKNCDMLYDESAPAGNAYFLNPKWLKLVYLKGGWMKMYPQVDPANQLANVHKVATFANMGSNNARRLGVVSAIT